MCDQHSATLITIPTASERGPYGKQRGIDTCIAPLVQALNDRGAATVACCCGHGGWGSIALEDGRELFLAPDYTAARNLDAEMARWAARHHPPPDDVVRRMVKEADEARSGT